MNKFMRDLNIPDDIINQLRLEALRLDNNNTTEIRSIIPKFDIKALPVEARSFDEWKTFLQLTDEEYKIPESFINAVDYLVKRKIDLFSYSFYYTSKTGFSNRIIIPFLYKGEIVGWTARAINDATPKYLSEQQPGYVFNLDNQQDDRGFVIVSEGPFDALSIDGCALLGAEIKDSQNWLLKQLGKELILVPDKDHEGPKTVERAIELGWSVSMPDWPEDVKDINDATVKLGKLATLWLIINNKESNGLKIQLRAKKWFKDV
jgi:DNA primase